MKEQMRTDIAKAKDLGKDFLDIHFPRFEELPRIELYLDQVIGILNDTLAPFFEYGEDKIITGAMVNNYVKHKVIEAPVKKRYNQTHLCCLFIICILKKVFSMTEISELFEMHGYTEQIEKNYNHFCQELEWALTMKFADYEVVEELRKTDGRSELDMERSMALAVANKLYVQKIIQSRYLSDSVKTVADSNLEKRNNNNDTNVEPMV